MARFSFDNGGRRCIRPILEKYQSGKGHQSMLPGYQLRKNMPHAMCNTKQIHPDEEESEGYTVKCKEKDFPISNYPLEQTEFYYAQKQGMAGSR